MSFEIKNLAKDKSKILNFIIYGESGVGKTSLAKTLNPEEILFLNCEAGMLSLGDSPIDYVDGLKLVEDCQSVVDQLNDNNKYKYVFLDSITEISQNQYEFLKDKYTKLEKRENKKPGSYNMQVWSDFLSSFSKLFKSLRDLKITVVALALYKEKEEKDGSITKGPDVYGKTQERIMAWFDECFYMYIDGKDDDKRKFLTQKVSGYLCKDRSDKLSKTEIANLSEIVKKIGTHNPV